MVIAHGSSRGHHLERLDEPGPESTLALRPSQRRAATNRAARREQRSATHWLRRLARS
jgi:hypothetical protein